MLKKNKTLLITIFLSVIVHIIVLLILRNSVSNANKSPPKQRTNNLIQAKLLFELPKPPVVKTQAPPTQPEEQPALPKPAPSLKPNRISTELEPIEVVASHPNPTPIPTQQEIKPQTKDKPVTAPPQVPRVEEQIATPVEPTNSTVINSQFTGTAGKHVQALNQQKDAQMAREAREYYQQQKNSPTLDTTNRNRFASEDEKLLDKTKVRANCDGITRKTASVLLGIMGARIDCTSKPDINTYINKHVNKEELLDAKYKQSQHKHPRSIVIQDPPNQDTHD